MLTRFLAFIRNHRSLAFLGLAVLVGGSYFGYQRLNPTDSQTLYVLAQVEKTSIINSVSGSGQISASNEVELKPKVSSDVTSVKATVGSSVKTGDVLVTFDARDGQKAVRDAQVSLASARLSLEKLQRGSRTEELQSAEMKVTNAQESLVAAQQNLIEVQVKNQTNLGNAYSDTQNTLRDTADKVGDILNRQINDLFLNGNSGNPKLSFLSSNSRASSDAEWQRAKANKALSDIRARIDIDNPSHDQLDQFLSDSKDDLLIVRDFLNNLDEAVGAGIATGSTSQSTINSYRSTVSSARTSVNTLITNLEKQKQTNVSQLTTNQDNITSAQDKIDSAQDSLEAAENDLALQKLAADPLDLKAQQISVAQRINALTDAQENLADYTLRSPIDGVIASVAAKVGDPGSTGTTAVTVITQQSIAEISLNEVDAAKVKAGQKATLTFDAIEGLEITGSVAEIDSLGTVSQGVVTYNAKISLDTQDDRIKPGMSVSSSIIIDFKADTLTVPNAAIKSQGSESYVLIPNGTIDGNSSYSTGVPLSGTANQVIQTGLSNDTNTEIISGLTEGDWVVVRTTKSSTAATPTSATPSRSILQTGGGPGGMH